MIVPVSLEDHHLAVFAVDVAPGTSELVHGVVDRNTMATVGAGLEVLALHASQLRGTKSDSLPLLLLGLSSGERRQKQRQTTSIRV